MLCSAAQRADTSTLQFIENELPVVQVRELHEDAIGFDRKWLGQAAELGWFSMLIPEADGGGSVSSEGLLDACIVAEELGRYVQPGPFVPMNDEWRAAWSQPRPKPEPAYSSR